MGRILVLPRTPEQMDRVAYYSTTERVPDFAARLQRWRREDLERREQLRRDIALIFDLAYLRMLVPPGEGA